MIKRIVIFLVISLLPVPCAQAQSSLKSALVEYLYQYGKEIFYRGNNPQEASFVFQRALVLECDHEGAKAFLNKLHKKYPSVSIREWGCAEKQPEFVADEDAAEEAPEAVSAEASDLNRDFEEAENQMNALAEELEEKDAVIKRYRTKLENRNSGEDAGDDVAYSTLAKDQTDLIKIQQDNIDSLKNELAEVKKQLKSGKAGDDAYARSQIDIAASGLDAQEQRMAAAAKDVESQDLRQRLTDLQEQLALIQKIVDDKNRTIETLEKELKTP